MLKCSSNNNNDRGKSMEYYVWMKGVEHFPWFAKKKKKHPCPASCKCQKDFTKCGFITGFLYITSDREDHQEIN